MKSSSSTSFGKKRQHRHRRHRRQTTCFQTQCLLGFLLGNISLLAWCFSIQASFDVFRQELQQQPQQQDENSNENNISFGLLGFHISNQENGSEQQQQQQDLKYTIQQEDVIAQMYAHNNDSFNNDEESSSASSVWTSILNNSSSHYAWKLGRYLYFVSCVIGLITSQLIWVSMCGGWPIISNHFQRQRKTLALLCFVLATLPISIMYILYTSPLCPKNTTTNNENDSTMQEQQPQPRIVLEYGMLQEQQQQQMQGTDINNEFDSNDINSYDDYDDYYYATTASVTTDSTATDYQCVPTDGTLALIGASILWFLCGFFIYCCCSGANGHRRRRNRRRQRSDYDNDHDSSALSSLRTPLLTNEPLLDPPTRTLGWIAKLTVITLFATFPYWLNAALIAMAPSQDLPFAKTSATSTSSAMRDTTTTTIKNTAIPGTQLLGPYMFNPTQEIAYSTDQFNWIDTAFDQAIFLAWIPFGLNALFTLPLVLYGRYQLSNQYDNNNKKKNTHLTTNTPYWPYAMFGLILLQLLIAGICIWIPLSVMQELCHETRYPELQFEFNDNDNDDTNNHHQWMGTDILYHSAMKTTCWPTETGQVYVLGGTVLSLIQCTLLIIFSIQYSNAQDILATFAGIEQDQQEKLLSSMDSTTTTTTASLLSSSSPRELKKVSTTRKSKRRQEYCDDDDDDDDVFDDNDNDYDAEEEEGVKIGGYRDYVDSDNDEDDEDDDKDQKSSLSKTQVSFV